MSSPAKPSTRSLHSNRTSLPCPSFALPPRYELCTHLRRSYSEFTYDNDESALAKELTLQVRKVIGPFAAPKKIFIVNDLPKTRSGKIMRRIMRKIVAGEGDQLGDLSTLADPAVVDQIKEKVAQGS